MVTHAGRLVIQQIMIHNNTVAFWSNSTKLQMTLILILPVVVLNFYDIILLKNLKCRTAATTLMLHNNNYAMQYRINQFLSYFDTQIN